MEKLWKGRFAEELDATADEFNRSINFDSRMIKQDITGSIAHARMLGEKNIIAKEDSALIVKTLGEILCDLEKGVITPDMKCEDVHMYVEQELTERIGDAGKRLHTARSRNDQVALDIRLYLRDRVSGLREKLVTLCRVICEKADETKDAVMPGYTHLQRAQPITFAHQLLAYGMMFTRDIGRFDDAAKRMNQSPLGSCALAGTTYDIDREMTAKELGFDGFTQNSIDGVSDRDFALELMSAASICMTHLSRFCEEIILYSSWEFKFIELSDKFTTGSSIMPQKKNSDMAELIRGKTGRVYGDLFALLTALKGLPLAYNKDMQEDKEAIFDCIDTLDKCLTVFTPMLDTAAVLKENMLNAAKRGFINATDLADYLTKKGVPFRTAYKAVGGIVGDCVKNAKTLEELTLDEYRTYSDAFESDLYDAIDLYKCVRLRTSAGGASPENVQKQIEYILDFCK